MSKKSLEKRIKALEKEAQHQKLNGMPSYPTPKGGVFRKLRAIILILLLILGVFYFARLGIPFP